MGHTILAHALFACNQLDLKLDNFFSDDGNAHKIGPLNPTKLRCRHAVEFPNRTYGKQILTVVCHDWDEVLRKILSYYKYYKYFPTEKNLQNFYQNYTNDVDPLEFLTITYFNSTQQELPNYQRTLSLGDYLHNRIDPLKDAIYETFNWRWNDDKSKLYYDTVLHVNKKYLNVLENLHLHVNNILVGKNTKCELNFWEKAIVLSMVCKHQNIHPSRLHWHDYKFLEKDTRTIVESINKL
jgi:hypothetical protein